MGGTVLADSPVDFGKLIADEKPRRGQSGQVLRRQAGLIRESPPLLLWLKPYLADALEAEQIVSTIVEKPKRIGSQSMVDRSQLASAMLALAFAAVMLVAGQLFIEYRSTSTAVKPVAMKNAPLPL